MSYDYWNLIRNKLWDRAFRAESIIERGYVDGKLVWTSLRLWTSNQGLPVTFLPIFSKEQLDFFGLRNPGAEVSPQVHPDGSSTDTEYKALKEQRTPGGLREKVEDKLEEAGVRPKDRYVAEKPSPAPRSDVSASWTRMARVLFPRHGTGAAAAPADVPVDAGKVDEAVSILQEGMKKLQEGGGNVKETQAMAEEVSKVLQQWHARTGAKRGDSEGQGSA